MRCVANINGVEVLSDKEVDSVVNARVNFSDGSWCDVATGQVENNGPGSIRLSSLSHTSGKTIRLGPTAYKAFGLQILRLDSHLNVRVNEASALRSRQHVVVEPPDARDSNDKSLMRLTYELLTNHGDSEIVVEAQGPEHILKAVTMSVRGGVLTIHSPESSRRSGSVMFSGGSVSIVTGGSISISNGRISIGSSGSGRSADDAVFTITMPRGTPIQATGVTGEIEIGDTEAPVGLRLMGSSDVTIGRIGTFALSQMGSSDVEVAEVKGAMAIESQGSGGLSVASGNVEELRVMLQGSGDMYFGGTAKNASLSLQGSGDIKVARVIGRLGKSSQGTGKIRVQQTG